MRMRYWAGAAALVCLAGSAVFIYKKNASDQAMSVPRFCDGAGQIDAIDKTPVSFTVRIDNITGDWSYAERSPAGVQNYAIIQENSRIQVNGQIVPENNLGAVVAVWGRMNEVCKAAVPKWHPPTQFWELNKG